MTEVVAVFVVALASLLVGWLLFAGVQRVGQSRGRKKEQRPTAEPPERQEASEQQGPAAVEREQVTAAAAREAEAILADARRAATTLTAEATRKAGTILGDAEKKAKAMLVEVEATRDRVRKEMAHDQGLMEDRRKALSDLLLNLLTQLQRRAGDGSTNLRPLNEVRQARNGRARVGE